MLEQLKIRNIAIIDEAEISFQKGLNIISGETGAGKSIVIDAIALLLGSRANTDLIRANTDEATVEGIFDISELEKIQSRLGEMGAPVSHDLLIKRTIHRSGKHRIYINGELATLSVLQKLCDGLIDLCSQHEHQTLVRQDAQLEWVDRYAGLEKQVDSYKHFFIEARTLAKEKREYEESASEREKKVDFLKFQIGELQAASLESGEEEKLYQEKQLLQSAEARVQVAEAARQALESEDIGALHGIRSSLNKLRALYQMDERILPILEGIERCVAEGEEAGLALNRYLGSVDLNSERLRQIQDRLALLADLRRKYGLDTSAMLETLSKLEIEMASIQQADSNILELTARLKEVEGDLEKNGKKLSLSRKKSAKIFSDSVTGELKDLQMAGARFQVDVNGASKMEDWTASGADEVVFTVQTNPGEPAKLLGKIASGGELSRLMLAIRRVISDKGSIGVYLFDEIDAGIGGKTAFQVGKKLKSVAQYNQVICITHLPQVAAFGDHHLVVRKQTSGKRTTTQIAQLQPKERKEELARMLAGPELTRRSLESAAELMELTR